jgi:hypothetical protein
LLLSKDGRNFLPKKLAWISKKAILPSSHLTADASSADKLLEYLNSQDDITWITLMDKRGIIGGLVVTTNKGQPKGASSKLTRTEKMLEDTAMLQEFSGDAIRKELQLTDSQSILLVGAWISDDERRLASMFPEVLFMDVTSQTNNEKRDLFMVAGKDSHGRGFTATCIFLPSEQKWVFRWIFSHQNWLRGFRWVLQSSSFVKPLHGIRQGNGGGPAIWTVVSSPVLSLMCAAGYGAEFICPLSMIKSNFGGYAFVNNTDLMVVAKISFRTFQ